MGKWSFLFRKCFDLYYIVFHKFECWIVLSFKFNNVYFIRDLWPASWFWVSFIVPVAIMTDLNLKLHFDFFYRCENGLMSFVNMKNCIRFFQTAEEISADLLKDHCSELISNHWVCTSFRLNQNFQTFWEFISIRNTYLITCISIFINLSFCS